MGGQRSPEDTDPDADAVRWQFDWSSTDPSAAVVELVSTVTDRDPTKMEPLYEAVDPDALDAFVTSADGSGENAVSFDYAGSRVSVYVGGVVAVRAVTTGAQSA